MLAHYPRDFDGLVGALACRVLSITEGYIYTSPITDMEFEEYTDSGPAFSLDLH